MACGRVEAALSTAEEVCLPHDIFKIWKLQLQAFSSLMQGNFDQANTYLDAMQVLQKNRYGAIYHHVLSAIMLVLKLMTNASSGDETSELAYNIKTLTRLSEQLSSKHSLSPIALLSTFLSAYVLCMLLPRVISSSDEKQLEILPHVVRCIDKLKYQLSAFARTFPFVKMLEETIEMKKYRHIQRTMTSYTRCFTQRASQMNSASFKQLCRENVTCLSKDFAFGKAFWQLEMSKIFEDVNIRDDSMLYNLQKLYRGAVYEFSRFGTTETHPFFL